MPRYLLKKHTITYKGKMYDAGSAIEMDVFDNKLPRDWFEEIKEEKPIVEVKKIVKTKIKEGE